MKAAQMFLAGKTRLGIGIISYVKHNFDKHVEKERSMQQKNDKS